MKKIIDADELREIIAEPIRLGVAKETKPILESILDSIDSMPDLSKPQGDITVRGLRFGFCLDVDGVYSLLIGSKTVEIIQVITLAKDIAETLAEIMRLRLPK